jgi:thiol-disulfide isomerase/thioredoxin
MLRHTVWGIVLGGCLGFFAGCGGGSSTPDGAAEGDVSVSGENPVTKRFLRATDDEGKASIPIRSNVTDMAGIWCMVFTSQQQDLCLWLVEFTKAADGSYSARLLDSANDRSKPQVVSTTVDGKDIHLTLRNEAAELRIDGRLADEGIVEGTFVPSPFEIYPVRLIPTTATKLEDYAAALKPLGLEQFGQIAGQDDPQKVVAGMLKFGEIMRRSPLALDAYASMIANARQLGITDEELQQLSKGYLAASEVWGPAMVAQTELNIGVQLAMQRRLPAAALEHLDKATALLSDEQKATLLPQIDMARAAAKIEVHLKDIRSEDAKVSEEAFALLRDDLQLQPYNHEVLLALAEYAMKHDDAELATKCLEDIVTLPLLEQFVVETRSRDGKPPGEPTPTDLLKDLYKKRTGSEDGFAEYVDEVHRRRFQDVVEDAKSKVPPPIDAKNDKRPALVEIMTGMFCPPCVATKVAATALEQQYPPERVIVLTYHQHIPGPDALTNSDNEERLTYYQGQGTPMVYVNGQQVEGVAGLLQQGASAYAVLRNMVDQYLASPGLGKIDLQTTLADGAFTVTANATDLPAPALDGLRLRVAIAEEEVDMKGPNGIRVHHMVVREMLGGAKGASPKRGELSFSHKLTMDELRKHVSDYLDSYEAGSRFNFPEKPLLMEKLRVVAWVQDERSRAVLVAASVPLGESTVVAAIPPEAPPADALNPANSPNAASTAVPAAAPSSAPNAAPAPAAPSGE